jgi:hypothetical protein
MKAYKQCPSDKQHFLIQLGAARYFTVALFSMFSFALSNVAVAESAANEVPINIQVMSKNAPPQTIHYGRLVGKWEIKDSSLGKDSKWQAGPGANWNFYWILGGSAIQDDWISPGYKTPAPAKGRQYGTNIRIFNPKTDQWEMAWAANTGKKIDTFKATSDEKSMIMNGVYYDQPTRITFYDISDSRFSWKMEKQDAKSKHWQAVYKIEGYKIKE